MRELLKEHSENKKRRQHRKKNLKRFLRRNTYHAWGEDSAMRIFGPKLSIDDKNFRRKWKSEHGKDKSKNIICANETSWDKLKDYRKIKSISIIYTPMGRLNKRK